MSEEQQSGGWGRWVMVGLVGVVLMPVVAGVVFFGLAAGGVGVAMLMADPDPSTMTPEELAEAEAKAEADRARQARSERRAREREARERGEALEPVRPKRKKRPVKRRAEEAPEPAPEPAPAVAEAELPAVETEAEAAPEAIAASLDEATGADEEPLLPTPEVAPAPQGEPPPGAGEGAPGADPELEALLADEPDRAGIGAPTMAEAPEEDSWIPEAFSSLVEAGVSMLTGAPEEDTTADAPPPPRDAFLEEVLAEEEGPRGIEAPTMAEGDPTDGVSEGADGPSEEEALVAQEDPVAESAPRRGDAAGRELEEGHPPPQAGARAPGDGATPRSAPVRVNPVSTPKQAPAPAPASTRVKQRKKKAPEPEPEGMMASWVSAGIEALTGGGMSSEEPQPTRRGDLEEEEEELAAYQDEGAGGDLLEGPEEEELVLEEVNEADAFARSPDVEVEEELAGLIEDEPLKVVEVRTMEPGVEVHLDGRAVGKTPLVIEVSGGPHKVKLGAATFTMTPRSEMDTWCFAVKGNGFREADCE